MGSLHGNNVTYKSKYGTIFNHLGYVVPKEYLFDKENPIYYEYENVTAEEAGSTR